MFLLIDNYDSFTYNLFHFLGEVGAEAVVYRNDAITPEESLALAPEGIIVSPGPCTPDKAGNSLDIVTAATGRLPILGVCLGHQVIAQTLGGKIVRAPVPMHGKLSPVNHDGSGVLGNIPPGFSAARYHSLIVERESLPSSLHITAETEDGLIMGIQHRELPLFGVQFHPESIATEHGHTLLKNFIAAARPGQNKKAA